MLFPQFYSFLLVCCFKFCFGCVLSSAHFVYCLPGYSRLSIFHRVSNLIYLILNVLSYQGKRTQPTLQFTHSCKGKIDLYLFPWLLAIFEMQIASFRIWTRVNESISYDDSGYTPSTINPFMVQRFAIHKRILELS